MAEEIVGQYADVLMETYNSRTAKKLGFKTYDRDLSVGFMQLMYEDGADFTNTWRALASVSSAEPDEEASTSSAANGNAGENGASTSGMPPALFKVTRPPCLSCTPIEGAQYGERAMHETPQSM